MASARSDGLRCRGIVQEGLSFLSPTQPGLTAARGTRHEKDARVSLSTLPLPGTR